MTVKIYPDAKGTKSSAILQFFTKYHVRCELIKPEDFNLPRVYKQGELCAVEVDGEVFVNPNDDALKKLLQIN